MQKLKSIFQKDLSRRAFWGMVLLVFAVRLLFAHFQMVYTWVGGAPLDDELMFRAAQNISTGQWLGAYDYLTLSKNMFFALWLAGCNFLHLPYLLAGQALWCAASLLAALAFAPVLKNRKIELAVFAVLAWNPATISAYTLRVYRDNIFPALCLLCIAGLCGFALRRAGGAAAAEKTETFAHSRKTAVLWLVVCGLGLACATLDREDGMAFLLPFVAAGTVICVIFAAGAKGAGTKGASGRKKLAACLPLTLPFVMLACGILSFCGLNNAYYGVFALSDFSEGSFAAAIGAMNRVAEPEVIPKVSIPTSVREQLYENVPELQPLRYWLEEDEQLQNDFRSENLNDYTCGSFYWAIRRAAQFEGIYETPQTAAEYWQTVADKINALCDSGALPAKGGKRVSTTPPILSSHILPTLAEGVYGFFYSTVFAGCSPYEAARSIGTPEDVALWQGYLHQGVNVAAEAGKDTPYYSPLQKLAYGVLSAVMLVYRFVFPLLLLAALILFVRKAVLMLRQKSASGLLLWLILLGILGMALFRCFMIAFVMVASFAIPTSLMYLAPVHGFLLLFAAVCLAVYLPRKKENEI